jgi:3-keto-disaccharide hydrolase
MKFFSLALVLLLPCTVPAADAPADAEGFVPLFNGRDLTGWVPVNVAPDTFTVRDGMVVISGTPIGYMRTEKMYENFVLECDWQHMKEGGNSGVFVWGDGVPAVGTGYTRGIEVQVLDNGFNAKGKNEWYTTHGDLFPIWGAKMTPSGRISKSGERSFPSEDRSKPSPEWNHYRITGKDGELRLEVNGKEVTVGRDCNPRKGYLALESEGSECHFRNIRIHELPSSNPPAEQIANPYAGYVSLFNGKDLTGWKVPAGDNGHWKVVNDAIDYDARSEAAGDKSLWTEHEYRDYSLIVDWRLKETPYTNPRMAYILPDGSEARDTLGKPLTLNLPDSDSGILLCGDAKYQCNIWCWPIGSGEMYGVRRDQALPAAARTGATPRTQADNPVGKWNRFEITVRHGSVSTVLNGKLVIPPFDIPNLPAHGPIGLQHHGAEKDGQWTSPPALVQFRNIFIKEE